METYADAVIGGAGTGAGAALPPSITIRPYAPEDAGAAVALWNACDSFSAAFPMDERLWRQNVDQCSATAWPGCLLACDSGREGRVVGLIAAKLPRHISAIAVHPESRRQGVGRALAEASIAAVLAMPDSPGPDAWTAGADLNHFFPGVPAEAEDALAFFRALGFSVEADERASYDLARDLGGFALSDEAVSAIERLRGQGIVIGPCRPEDVPALRAFLAEEFPGRWLDDTMRRIDEFEPDASEVIVARDQEQKVLGFAHTFSNRSRWLGPPVYWRASLGSRYGGLGPIGVARRARGIGLGLALLAAGVKAVAKTGAEQMAIDWTDLLDFYARVGFSPWKKYLSAWRSKT